MSEALTLNDVKQLVLKEILKLDENRIYYELRKISHKLIIRPQTKEYVKACVALTNLGLPIKTEMVCLVLDKNSESVRHSLHNLGDKHILVFKRTKRRNLEWIIRPSFYEKVL